ncbi:unnamed protein product [Rotaria sordida]|uniref:ADP-ribosylglycohydrolase n=4 Tax=Rotaria sordida TaxID=392033 RepID=A0A814G5X6_9BILA|nr:unnamed protein product [Rotaria sordida]CAF0994092.1 unnamed protein product [Rotaria sordida]
MEKIQNSLKQFKAHILRKPLKRANHSSCQFQTEKKWLRLQYHANYHIKKPDELENGMEDPPGLIDEKLLDKTFGSLIGLALGDALGAHVEFRPHEYLLLNPVKDLEGGGTWGLKKGQFTDDASMALCLGISLVARRDFIPYDQLVRYKWWFEHGYMSSTGHCFDIGAATSQSLQEFIHRQTVFAKSYRIPLKKLDYLSDPSLLQNFSVYCSKSDVAGNGALMRLAPVPLFFYKHPQEATEFSGYSGQITHGDNKAYDACRYYGALICATLNDYTKEQLLDKDFYKKHKSWFGNKPLCEEIKQIAEGSYKKKGGYQDGIRGKGYIVNALEAALWAFWSDNNSFEQGVLAAINLGDDTDTTAAIYGQLAGAYYGYKKLPKKWVNQVYANKFILNLSKWIVYEGENWKQTDVILPSSQCTADAGNSVPIEHQILDVNIESVPLTHRNSGNKTVPIGKQIRRHSILDVENSNNHLISNQYTVSQFNLNEISSLKAREQISASKLSPVYRPSPGISRKQYNRKSPRNEMNAAN